MEAFKVTVSCFMYQALKSLKKTLVLRRTTEEITCKVCVTCSTRLTEEYHPLAVASV